ncbi:MAG: hypothetical protein R6X13_12320 [bacterium]
MHRATARFWRCYRALPARVQQNADAAFRLLRSNPGHPSLHLKPVGNYWSVRVGIAHRALALSDGDDYIWVWVGTHDQYHRLLRGR